MENMLLRSSTIILRTYSCSLLLSTDGVFCGWLVGGVACPGCCDGGKVVIGTFGFDVLQLQDAYRARTTSVNKKIAMYFFILLSKNIRNVKTSHEAFEPVF